MTAQRVFVPRKCCRSTLARCLAEMSTIQECDRSFLPPATLREFVAHYLGRRLHQGLDGRLIAPIDGAENDNSAASAIQCRSRLGGLLNDYHREAV
jgi:hypothetical protein